MKPETKSALTTIIVDQAIHIIRTPGEWPNHQQWAKQLITDWVRCGFPDAFDKGDADLFKLSFDAALKRKDVS